MASRRQTTSNGTRRRESEEGRQARREYQEALRSAQEHERSRSQKTEANRRKRTQVMRRRVTVISVLLILLTAGGAAFAVFVLPRLQGGTGATGVTVVTEQEREQKGSEKEQEPAYDPTDADGDGIPNQEDIFQSAMAYVATKPIYESRYYQEGYPTDGYGVCTDVVGFAFLGAGLDLQQLIKEDIENHREDYPEIETPDPKIDFRRVPNIRTFLERTAESLTTDVEDTDAWQPGDIVTWPHHIGIISDRRNERGVPLVIHHAGKNQTNYVEDILEGNSHYTYAKDITGHYRVK